MKFWAILLFAAVSLVCLQAAEAKKAEDSKGTPSFSVKTFYTAMAKADFVTAKKYLEAKELIQMIAFVEEMIKESPELKDETKKDFAPMAQAKFISEKITGNKAEVVISYTENGKPKKDTVKLKKVKDLWLIAD